MSCAAPATPADSSAQSGSRLGDPLPALVYIGLGSNLGDRMRSLERAIAMLDCLPDTRVFARSRVYVTAPVGFDDQPDFLNMVIALETRLEPLVLLDMTGGIETSLGRAPGPRWGPRPIDIDVLWYHGLKLRGPRIEIPHPRLEERRFVLEPLSELDPGLVLLSGRTVAQALQLVGGQRVEVYESVRQDGALEVTD